MVITSKVFIRDSIIILSWALIKHTVGKNEIINAKCHLEIKKGKRNAYGFLKADKLTFIFALQKLCICIIRSYI